MNIGPKCVYSAARRSTKGPFPPQSYSMRTNLLFAVVALLPVSALAQNDWNAFPSNFPPPATVDAGTPAAPRSSSKLDETPDVPRATTPPPSNNPPPAANTPPPAANNPPPSHSPGTTPKQDVDAAARARTEERLRAAQGLPPQDQKAAAEAGVPGAVNPDDKLPVVSKKEQFLPGTEPHSPSTWGRDLTDPWNARVTASGVGIGLINNTSARLGPEGIVRFSVLGQYLSQGDFPVKSANDIRSGATFAVSYQPFTWGEIFLGYSASANTNDHTAPNLIQALGDITFGIKASKEWTQGLWAGADARLLTFSGVGNQGIDHFAVGFQPRLIGAYDFRALSPSALAILHLNVGFLIDNTGGLLSSIKPNASEEFALGINRYNRFTFGLGLEIPLPVASPFVEYTLGAPLGVKDLVGPDQNAVSVGQVMPQKLTLGAKVTAIKDLTLLVAVDIGLSQSVGIGVPATPPWNFMFGASFNIDPFQRGETKIVDTVRERTLEKKVAEAPKTAKVEGTVIDKATKKPIPGVIVATVGGNLPPVASDAKDGRFLTHELTPGTVKLQATRDGYKEIEQELKLEPGKTQKLELQMESEVKKATFMLTVQSKKKPVNAGVSFVGAGGTQSAATAESTPEPVKVEAPGGTWTVNVTADGYLAKTKEVQVTPGATMNLAFDLEPAPKKSLVIVKDDKIEILQQVHFVTGQATILADSYSLLAQVVDAIVKNGIKRVKIEGHTDNRGDKAFNQKLSEARAQSVADYLKAQGVEASRLESQGFGDSKPVAPNLTARGRELNRRVEFIILER